MTRTLERVQRPVPNAMNFSPLEPEQGGQRPVPIVAKGDSSVQQMLQIRHNNFGRLRVDFPYFSGPASR